LAFPAVLRLDCVHGSSFLPDLIGFIGKREKRKRLRVKEWNPESDLIGQRLATGLAQFKPLRWEDRDGPSFDLAIAQPMLQLPEHSRTPCPEVTSLACRYKTCEICVSQSRLSGVRGKWYGVIPPIRAQSGRH
jgi:hypothetical protein